MSTYMAKAENIDRKWYIVDAANKPLGRTAATVAALLRGKHNVVGGFLILISSRQACWRPPGARFFLLQRRKNRGRKTPLRAGGGPPALRTHPCIRRRGCSRTLYGVPGRLVTASVVRPGKQTARRFACAYGLLQ